MDKVTYDIIPHTIFLTIGPSGCGKTYFCKNILIPQLEKLSPQVNRNKVSINYVSSDDIRRNLLGQPDLDKNHYGMLTASKPAFDLLYAQVDAATTFPVNSEFVIVDTKGTNENFRKKIFDIAYKNHYSVTVLIFNYKKYEDYKKFSSMSRFTQKDIEKVREISSSGLKRNNKIRQVISIKSIDFEDSKPELSFSLHDFYTSCFIDNSKETLIISDIHGCYDEFVELLEKNDIKVENHKITQNEHNKTIIINGDYIDKGPKSLDMIEFCYQNINDIYITIGNHENRLYKELTENLEHISEPWFDTYDIITDEYKQKFIDVFKKSLPFVMNDKFIATHAPCHSKYIGKVDGKSISRQRYYMKKQGSTSLYDEFSEIGLFDTDISNITYIFGHVQTSSPGCAIDKRILADGGCVIGGKLLGIEISYNGKVFKKYVDSHQPKDDELLLLKPYRFIQDTSSDLDYNNMTEKEKSRIEYMVEDKVNFISGTMSPCDKMNDQLESIESAIDYFKSLNINDVVIEPKYMGSRMNMYLFEKNEDSYAISRNGYKVGIDINVLFDKMRNTLKDFIDWNKVKLIILDGECMPWHAMGKELIRDFRLVDDNVRIENQFLKESGFEEQFKKMQEKMCQTDFVAEKNNMSKKELIEKYGNYDYENFMALSEYKEYVSVEQKDKLIDIYREQLHLYGEPGELDYKPFAILKIVYKDGQEECWYDSPGEWTNESMFNLLNKDGCYRFDLSNEDDINKCINQFRQYTFVEKYEGVVMKPNSLVASSTIPYMKIRNPEYLTIIYGFDYKEPRKYEKLYERKSIKGKLKLSCNEWATGLKMLRIPYDSIDKSNNKIKHLFANFIVEDKRSESFDPRL